MQGQGQCRQVIECGAAMEAENGGELRMQNPGWATIGGWLRAAVPGIDPEFTARDFLYDVTGGVVKERFLPRQAYGFARLDRRWIGSSKVSAPHITIEGKATFAKDILSFFKELFEKLEEQERYWEERNPRRNPVATILPPGKNHPSPSVDGMKMPESLEQREREAEEAELRDEREMEAAFRAAELRTSRRK